MQGVMGNQNILVKEIFWLIFFVVVKQNLTKKKKKPNKPSSKNNKSVLYLVGEMGVWFSPQGLASLTVGLSISLLCQHLRAHCPEPESSGSS